MKTFIFSFALAATAMAAQAESVLVGIRTYNLEGETKTEEKSSAVDYYYNADMNQYLKFSNGFTQYKYTDGVMVQETVFSNYGSSLLKNIKYTYDENGNMITKVESQKWGDTEYQYTNFVNGQYTHYTMTSNSITNEFDVQTAFDTQGNMLFRFGQSTNLMEIFTCNYSNVLLQKETLSLYSVNSPVAFSSNTNNRREVYVYNEDGTKAADTVYYYSYDNTIPGYVPAVQVVEYVYDDLTSAMAPKNLKATATGVNRVELTWDAVEGAEAYVVTMPKSYGNQVDTVAATTFTTQILQDGGYYFHVMPIIGGEARHAVSTRAYCAVEDKSKLPATDFAVTKSEYKETENSWGGIDKNYVLTVTWKQPQTEGKVLSQKVKYGSYDYEAKTVNDVKEEGGVYTGTVALATYDCLEYDYNAQPDENWNPKTLTLSLVLTYETGDADKSNEVSVSPVEMANDPTSVAAVRPTVEDAANYNLNGQRATVQDNVKINGTTRTVSLVR